MVPPRQTDLFSSEGGLVGLGSAAAPSSLPLAPELLINWQRRVASLQRTVGLGQTSSGQLPLLASSGPDASAAAAAAALDPHGLTPQNLDFWRWPTAPQQGAAIYFVIDRPPHLDAPLLLYVGETGRADRRWKGDHDCKSYLAFYSEALSQAELSVRLSIRFWCDVPAAISPRRALEQALIRRWLPPFNKETRERWATPFTADLP